MGSYWDFWNKNEGFSLDNRYVMCTYLSHYLNLWKEYLLFNDIDVHDTCRDRPLFSFTSFPPLSPTTFFLMSLKSWLEKHFKLGFKAIQLKNVKRSQWLLWGYVSLNQMSDRRLGFCLGRKEGNPAASHTSWECPLRVCMHEFCPEGGLARSTMLQTESFVWLPGRCGSVVLSSTIQNKVCLQGWC